MHFPVIILAFIPSVVGLGINCKGSSFCSQNYKDGDRIEHAVFLQQYLEQLPDNMVCSPDSNLPLSPSSSSYLIRDPSRNVILEADRIFLEQWPSNRGVWLTREFFSDCRLQRPPSLPRRRHETQLPPLLHLRVLEQTWK